MRFSHWCLISVVALVRAGYAYADMPNPCVTWVVADARIIDELPPELLPADFDKRSSFVVEGSIARLRDFGCWQQYFPERRFQPWGMASVSYMPGRLSERFCESSRADFILNGGAWSLRPLQSKTRSSIWSAFDDACDAPPSKTISVEFDSHKRDLIKLLNSVSALRDRYLAAGDQSRNDIGNLSSITTGFEPRTVQLWFEGCGAHMVTVRRAASGGWRYYRGGQVVCERLAN